MNRPVTIYAIIRSETGDAYVGSTVQKTGRWNTHRYLLRHGRHHCRHLQSAWNKYGEDAFGFVVLTQEGDLDRSERLILETTWVATLGTYNVHVAAERAGLFTIGEADRELRRQAALAKIEADPVHRAKLQKRGQELADIIRSPEGRANMGAHTKRRWAEPDERAKLSQGLVNRWADPDAHAHMSEKTGERMRSGTNAADHGAKLKAAWADPEKGARLRARLESRWKDPEARARQAAAQRDAWKDPEVRERRLVGLRARWEKRKAAKAHL